MHLHCLAPGGALSDQGHWHAAKSNYLFPVKALSRHFRGNTVSALSQAAKDGELHRVTRPDEIDATLDQLMRTDWVVYTKAYLQNPDTVVDYLGRYSRKIALNDRRIVELSNDRVGLRYKDYQDHDRHKTMSLTGEELIRRFLLHILPQGFMRIRHFGFLANRCRKIKLAQIRAGLKTAEASKQPDSTESGQKRPETGETPAPFCPRRQPGRWIGL